MVYASIPVLAIVMWWQFGWISALGALVALLIGSSVVKLALPRPSSEHYRRLILRSMCGRYANYVRDGDALRAGAMKDLLNRAGMDLDAMRGS
ncbi:MAG: hypothetical protein HYX94_12125 [Chloroflexi bacterium]|nr:hypothetical protein [Chloroflexota bacterium]